MNTHTGQADATPTTQQRLPRAFYQRHPTLLGPDLLNKLLVRDDGRVARIVEVEAYAGGEDPAAHSFRGPTPRTATMFGPPGRLYVYFSYGVHWCGNVVCGEPGAGMAVLLRAAEPLRGLDLMRRARPAAAKDRDLCSGPGKLCQAFGISREHDGADLVTCDRGFSIASDGTAPPPAAEITPRVGISKAVDLPWRWHVAGNPHVSRPGRGRIAMT